MQTYGLEGKGDFPISEESHLANLPIGTKVLTIDDSTQIDQFLAAENNEIKNDNLKIGKPRPPMKIDPPRDIKKEFDDLKSLLIQKGVI